MTYTLADAFTAVADNCRDITYGSVTAAGNVANVLQDSAKVGGRDNHWVSSEIVFLPSLQDAGRQAANPFPIIAFNSSTGTFTMNKDYGISLPASVGTPYVIIRTRGQGNPYRTYINAIRYALSRMDASTLVDNVTLSVDKTLSTYTIPTTLDSVYDVRVNVQGNEYSFKYDDFELGVGHTLQFRNRNYKAFDGYPLRVMGRSFSTLPDTLGGLLSVPFDELVDSATEQVLRTSQRPTDGQKAANYTQERVRFQHQYPLPNEKFFP